MPDPGSRYQMHPRTFQVRSPETDCFVWVGYHMEQSFQVELLSHFPISKESLILSHTQTRALQPSGFFFFVEVSTIHYYLSHMLTHLQKTPLREDYLPRISKSSMRPKYFIIPSEMEKLQRKVLGSTRRGI